MGVEQFEYAKLFDPVKQVICTDGNRDDLVYGPETAKRIQQNTDACAVTVCCITYKHEEFIRQALDSFVMQKTNFKFKVFVGEDKGPDGTADIIREYAERYPDIIVPFIREENMGAQRNLIDLCNHACSPYIAFCEGDDFWIDEYKLQKQFDYMQQNKHIRMCYTGTEIQAPEDWHLNTYYRKERDGRMIIPYCAPGFKKKPYYDVDDFTVVFPNHTSSAFYRWDYDLVFPEWYFHGLLGDIPCTILQMGMGKAVYLPDVTSVYRRSDVGVFMNHDNLEHFAKTRLDYVRFLTGLRIYFEEHYNGAFRNVFVWRTTKEIVNYLETAKAYGDPAMITALFERYPEEAFETMRSLLGSFKIYNTVKRRIGKKNEYALLETRKGIFFAIPGIMVYNVFRAVKTVLKKCIQTIGKAQRGCKGLIRYWKNTYVEKQKNLWVFSGFQKKNYMDNSRYLFEYIRKNHPEIQAVWVTENKDVCEQLQREGYPVERMDTAAGRKLIAKAEVAVTDHFVMSDYGALSGFNDRTKVVQLWHGVGFKSMGDGKKVHNTDIKGVQYSGDILSASGDSAWVRAKKKIKYIFKAPFRERFEQYFMFVCPGQERVEMIGHIWNIPESSYFMAGHPRNLSLYEEERATDPVKVIYAPTYRFNAQREKRMIQEFLDALPEIQEKMEEINGEFVLRLHPHTWRNYSHKIERAMEKFDRISRDETKDIYLSLGTYSIMISDYSSIAMDFAMLDRPVIFLGSDFEWFMEYEAGFNLDFKAVIPGPMTSNWQETLLKVKEYWQNPDQDLQFRRERCRYFFEPEANGPDNSERIVEEIKRRIGLN